MNVSQITYSFFSLMPLLLPPSDQPLPSISPAENQVRVNGTSITLSCTDSVGVPPPDFTWMRDGTNLLDSGEFDYVCTVDTSVPGPSPLPWMQIIVSPSQVA